MVGALRALPKKGRISGRSLARWHRVGSGLRTAVRQPSNGAASSSSVRDYTHNDIDAVLTQLGVKRFKSLLKREKLSKVIKFKECTI